MQAGAAVPERPDRRRAKGEAWDVGLRTGRRTQGGGAGRFAARACGTVALAAALAGLSLAPATAATGSAAAVSDGAAARAVDVPLGDRPAGFFYGSDSRQVTITGSAPYSEPVTGGAYGGHTGRTGHRGKLPDCRKIIVWRPR